jgi:hypothetical protein
VLDPMAGFDIPEDLRAKVKSSKNFRSASFWQAIAVCPDGHETPHQ